MGFFQRTQERVQNSRGKRAISVRAIEVLLLLGHAECLHDVTCCITLRLTGHVVSEANCTERNDGVVP